MPWATSTRRKRLPADWAKRRARVLRRDRHTCQVCGVPADQVDHIVRGDDHSYTNLQAICDDCHKAKTQLESAAAKPRRQRPPEPHPGLIQPPSE